jgi:hypothetical protein
MPVRFLQQGVAGSGGSFIAAQQQQQQVRRDAFMY